MKGADLCFRWLWGALTFALRHRTQQSGSILQIPILPLYCYVSSTKSLTNCGIVSSEEGYADRPLQVPLNYCNRKSYILHALLYSVGNRTETNHGNWTMKEIKYSN